MPQQTASSAAPDSATIDQTDIPTASLRSAHALAEGHRLIAYAPSPPPIYRYLTALPAWLEDLLEHCRSADERQERAASWILDNDYQIRRAIRQVREDFPQGFLERLPALAHSEDGHTAGDHSAEAHYPRVLSVLQAMFEDSQLQPSKSHLVQFVNAYQDIVPLIEAELWAIPSLARLYCLDVLVQAGSAAIGSVTPPYTTWLHEATDAEQPGHMHSGGRLDATEQVARAITALKILTDIDWHDFVEQTSHLESLLQTDPAHIYSRMDRDTRSRYRREVERMARESGRHELEVAEKIVSLASSHASVPDGEPAIMRPDVTRERHVGYWIIAEGRQELDLQIGARTSWRRKSRRLARLHAGRLYTLSLGVLMTLLTALPVWYASQQHGTVPQLLLVVLLALLPASVIAISLVNWIASQLLQPTVLPSLDPACGVPQGFTTAVAVPVIIRSAAEVSGLIEKLELRHLANPEPGLVFVLLSDPADAETERTAEDSSIEQALKAGIRALNERVEGYSSDRFLLLHRHRVFNESQGHWMAHERKRGKIEQFALAITEGRTEPFAVTEGDLRSLSKIRFLISLDADTMLPPGSALRMICTLAHPLNLAVFDAATGRVQSGYTILQPRIETLILGRSSSLFARLFAGDSAIDIYSRAVSDVYQDVFGYGSYVGKGMVDVRAMQRSLAGRVPENAILSHDLFEGLHGRVALATNIILYEDYPSTWPEHAARQHRWIRGDWQLLPWIRKRVPVAGGERALTMFNALDRWKLIDNLRRSIVPLGMLAFFLGSWFLFPGNAWIWTLLAVTAFAPYLINEAFASVARLSRRDRSRGFVHRARLLLARWSISICFLVVDALISLDAAGRTLWRVLISRRNLLQWQPSAQMQQALAETGDARAVWRLMWPSPAAAVLVLVALPVYAPASLAPASPILLAWLLAPWIAIHLGRARRFRREVLSAEERRFLQRAARRTWHYFDSFCQPEDNWLPPDNYQSQPGPLLAHRTSPTNIGLYLASTIAARDLGFIGTRELMVRCRTVLDVIERLPLHHGHMLNWIDTRTLEPLEPRYVSTVDSGNLAICLLAVRQGCLELMNQPFIDTSSVQGLIVTLHVLQEEMMQLERPIPAELSAQFGALEHLLADTDADALRERIEQALQAQHWPRLEQAIVDVLATVTAADSDRVSEIHVWLERLDHQLRVVRRDIDELAAESASAALTDELASVAERAGRFAYDMKFAWLYDASSRLLRIGYNLSSDTLDANHYDLLASEARMASFFAIAKKDVPLEHWFHLGRPVVHHDGQPAAQSWSGSMFEYLMPPLFLPGKRDTLLGESESVAVLSQQAYAKLHSIPWGVSESAFALTDAEGNYQYRAFGTPALGIRRGLSDDLVVAPYASMLALGIWPRSAVANLRTLAALGASARYGFIDALDYTPDRLVGSEPFVAVRTWMAHHQGMSLLAIGNVLTDDAMPRRVLAERSMQAVELLLQERVPWDAPVEQTRPEAAADHEVTVRALPLPGPWIPTGPVEVPQLQFLGNGRLSARVSRRGGGGLFYRDLSLTRWTPDGTQNGKGYRIHVADEQTGERAWLGTRARVVRTGPGEPAGDAAYGSTRDGADSAAASAGDTHVVFAHHLVEMVQRLSDVIIRVEIAVAAHDDVDARRITVTNERAEPVQLLFTSYAEVALAKPADDERHPAFSKLFIGSRYEAAHQGVSFERRPRHPREQYPVLLHRLVHHDDDVSFVGFETDRHQWLGRLGDDDDPIALAQGLSGTLGWTLDPVMALQARVLVQPGETRQLAFVTLVGESCPEVLERSAGIVMAGLDRLIADAALYSARALKRLAMDPVHLPDLQNLASLVVYPHSALRTLPSTAESTQGSYSGGHPDGQLTGQPAELRGGQPDLWPFGVSGDLPVLLLLMDDGAPMDMFELLLKGQTLWRGRGLSMDLVVLRTGPASYEEPLRLRILDTMREADAYGWLGRYGGVHLLSTANMNPVQIGALRSCASVVLDTQRTLSDRLEDILPVRSHPPGLQASASPPIDSLSPLVRPVNLLFDNGLGGFDPGSGEYLLHLEPGATTPAPWSNVLANADFGSVVTEAGLGFSWALNSGEHRLSTWSNDPVADRPGEMLYLRDEATAEYWSLTPSQARCNATVQVRHGFGYSMWTRHDHGLEQELTAFVDLEDPVKIMRVRLTNRTTEVRRLTLTMYVEWVLGALPSRARDHVVSSYDPVNAAVRAESSWNPEFAGRTAFLSADRSPHSVTGNRMDFLGMEGDIHNPAALQRSDLGGTFTAGADVCGAYQVHVDLHEGETCEVVFMLGDVGRATEVATLITAWRSDTQARVEQALVNLREHWASLMRTVQVRTPDAGFDLMVNHWLIYQCVSSRLLARAGYYQAGGAFGFRDQLQDVLAMLPTDPRRARQQILLAAEYQFEEGDVLHWWHPPGGRGVRTRITDDRLWLPWVTARYITTTGDWSILAIDVPFLQAPPLADDEEDRYAQFSAGASASLYEHCCRALDISLQTGSHGLPLMGTGDWNDGMDQIGHEGRGESVWLAWFQISVIASLVPLAEQQGDTTRILRWQEHAASLKTAIDTHAWDGHWYVRAFDDDGEPWGSNQNEECRIDAIAQAWGVLAGFGDEQRVRDAMDAADEQLVDPANRIVRLLTPAFHDTPRNPGYIKAYPPGIRENGGQYTHAAAWLGLAFTGIGDGDRAFRIFDFINPTGKSTPAESMARYRREPYVLSADIGGVGEHLGRGGWSWYTGAAGWTWQLAVHGILGIEWLPGHVRIEPCLPTHWDHLDILLHPPVSAVPGAETSGDTANPGTLALVIDNRAGAGRGIEAFLVDGSPQADNTVAFPPPGIIRRVDIRLGDAERRQRTAGAGNSSA